MRTKLDIPEVASHASGRGGHEDDLGPAETEHPGPLGEVTVVADEDPDARERGVEGREPEIARCEVVLLVAAWLGTLRGIHEGDAGLPVLAQAPPIRPEHRRGAEVASVGGPLEH